jgi:catechol 2,3-dioxygenase-like lactoylglutathione lyase family enzyme
VRRFHQTAIENGGTDEGEPGLRPHYNAHYYGAFVRDPDGNKIEAVTYTARESFGL